MKFKQLIVLNRNECGERGGKYYELERRPLNHCPHCNKELTILNSEKVDEKFIEVQIDAITGEAKIIK